LVYGYVLLNWFELIWAFIKLVASHFRKAVITTPELDTVMSKDVAFYSSDFAQRVL